MTYKEKARLFHDLAQLVKSGVPFPKAVESLGSHASGDSASVLRGITRRLKAGDRVAEAIEAQIGRLDSLETGIIAASDTAGTLDTGLRQCSEYYESLAAAKSRIRSKLAYPLFILHFAAFTFSIPSAFGDHGSIERALRSALTGVAAIWIAIFAITFVSKSMLSAARGSALFDTILRNLPVFGKLRRAFAMSRFCAAYNMQLDAGINVYSTLDASGRASGSAVVANAVARASKVVSEGRSVADGIAPSGAFPEPVVRAFLVGEQTGSLDHELSRLAAEYRDNALQRLDAIAEWGPRMLLIGVAVLIGVKILQFYVGYFKSLNDIMSGN
jgi:type IV pilus assembly protein PilC